MTIFRKVFCCTRRRPSRVCDELWEAWRHEVFDRGHPTWFFEETRYEGSVVLVNAERNMVVKRLKRHIGLMILFDGIPKVGENVGFVEIRRYGVRLDEIRKDGLRAFAEARHERRREGWDRLWGIFVDRRHGVG